MTDWKMILLVILCTLFARSGFYFVLMKIIARLSPDLHRIKITAMRRVLRDEEEQFTEKHGYPVDEHDDDPTDESDYDPDPRDPWKEDLR